MAFDGPVVQLRGVRKGFGLATVLSGLDLDVRRGENVAVLGLSGSGKSVLLKLIIGLLRPDEGEVCLWGAPLSGLSEEEMTPFRRRMGFVFQSGALFDSISVADNVAFPLREILRLPPVEIERRVAERLDWVGLGGMGARQPAELSGGMRKRVALARTLSMDPELVLYDEPTTGLDPQTGLKVATVIRDLDRKLDSTSLVVTHDIECARVVASRWAFLADGRIVADGTPEEILGSRVPAVRDFLATSRTRCEP